MKKFLALVLLILSITSSQVHAREYIFDIDAPTPIIADTTPILESLENLFIGTQKWYELLKPISKNIPQYTGFLKRDFAVFLALQHYGIFPKISKNKIHHTSPFSDVSTDSFFLPYIAFAKKHHLINNFSANTFAPNEYILQSDFLQMIANIQAKQSFLLRDTEIQQIAEDEMIFSSAGESKTSFSLHEALQRVQSVQVFEYDTLYTAKDKIIGDTFQDNDIYFSPHDSLESYSLFFDYTQTPFLARNVEILDASAIETWLIEKINSYRVNNGIGAVQKNIQLSETAKGYAQYMFENKHFEHKDLDGNNAGNRALSNGYDYAIVLENLWRWQTSIDEIMNDWKKSPSHNKNIIYPDVSDVGIGFYGNYWVLLFWQKMNTKHATKHFDTP